MFLKLKISPKKESCRSGKELKEIDTSDWFNVQLNLKKGPNRLTHSSQKHPIYSFDTLNQVMGSLFFFCIFQLVLRTQIIYDASNHMIHIIRTINYDKHLNSWKLDILGRKSPSWTRSYRKRKENGPRRSQACRRSRKEEGRTCCSQCQARTKDR